MKKHHFRTISYTIIVLLLSGTFKTKAQTISYYPWRDMISVATNPSKAIWVNFNIPTGLTSTLSTEVSPMINLGFSSVANVYAGAGVNLD
ncbi:MAG: hypothetical protein KA313_10705, partial [Pseudarcicella sp.]|nr:hypothetical protein [Pseudarcicella sp.]